MKTSYTVLIPSYKSTEYIEEAINSVLNQTIQADEIIIGTNIKAQELKNKLETYLKDPRFKFLDVGGEEIQKPSRKFNMIAEIATSTHLIFLCEDDMLCPTFIEEVSQYPEYDVVYTDMEVIGMNPHYEKAQEWNAENFRQSTVPFVNSVVKKDMWSKIKWRDEGYSFFDWDFWWRCFKAGATAKHIEKYLFLYRTHPKQDSNFVNMALARENTIKNNV